MAIPAKSSHGSFADPDIQVEESADADLASDEAQLSPPTHWQRVADYLLSDPTRRYLPYAAVAAAAVCAGIGILIATGTNSDAADDATALSGKASDSQSFDDPAALLPGYETTTGTTESGLSEIPGDVPPPGEGLGIDPAAVEEPLGPVTVTQTESGYPVGGDPVLTDDPVLTETATETPAPTTVTETSSGPDWPNISLNGSVTVPSPAPGSHTTVTETPASTPSTVTVIVTPSTVSATPSTVTVVVPAETTTTSPQRTTTAPKPTTTAPKPTTCRTATPSTTSKAPKATTTPPSGTHSSRPSTTTKPQATTAPTRTCR